MANSGIVALGVVLVLVVLFEGSRSQVPIPPRYDGFEYRPNITFNEVLVEAFFDPLCPDSRDAWPPLKEALYHYKQKVGLVVKFYNNETLNVTPASIIQKIILLATKELGASSLGVFEDGFRDRATDIATRISFKYGCSRAVTGTPYFFVNGIPLNNGDEIYDYKKWRSIIDPLLAGHISA